MQAEFGAKREHNNTLYYNSCKNDSGVFHFHSQIELYFIDEGEMEVLINDRRKVLKAGEMSVALSFVPHGYSTPHASRSTYIVIPTHMCNRFVAATRDKLVENPFICDKEIVARIRNCYEQMKREGINDIEKHGHIYVMLGIIMDHLSFESSYSPITPELSSKILLYISENYKTGITPGDVAEHFGYSQSHISRYFKSCFNITLVKYITIIRLKNAMLLMREGAHNTTYCALESGFSSMRTFYRAFYDEFGCSPKEYLNRK